MAKSIFMKWIMQAYTMPSLNTYLKPNDLMHSFWCSPFGAIHDPRHTECSNLTEAIWTQYICWYIYIYITYIHIILYHIYIYIYIYIYLYLRIAGPSPPTKGLPPPHLLFTYFSSKNSLLRRSPRHSTGRGTSRIPSVGLNCKFFCLMRKCKKKKGSF